MNTVYILAIKVSIHHGLIISPPPRPTYVYTGPPVQLRHVVTQCGEPGDRVYFANKGPVSVHHGAESRQTHHIGALQLHDVYSQKYLVAYSFFDGKDKSYTQYMCTGCLFSRACR